MAIKKAEMQSIEAHRDVCMRENLRVLEEREREEGMCPAAYSLRGVARAATSSEVANRRAGGVSGCSRGPKLKWTLNLHHQRLMNRQVYVSGFGGH